MNFNPANWYRDRQHRQLQLEIVLTRVDAYLTEIKPVVRWSTSTLQRLEKSMSALSDAVTALTAAKASEETELKLVLDAVSGFPQKVTDAVNAAIQAGADPAALAGIQAVTAEIAADQKRMVDALNATPPAAPTTTPPAASTASPTTTTPANS